MAKSERLFSYPALRMLACTFGALVASVVITGGAPIYLPFGEIDSIGVPILLFPVTWALLLLFCSLVKNIVQVWSGLIVLIIVHSALIFLHLSAA